MLLHGESSTSGLYSRPLHSPSVVARQRHLLLSSWCSPEYPLYLVSGHLGRGGEGRGVRGEGRGGEGRGGEGSGVE